MWAPSYAATEIQEAAADFERVAADVAAGASVQLTAIKQELAAILQAPVAPLPWHDTDQTLASPPFGACTYRVLYANGASPRTLISTGTIRGEPRTVRYTGQPFALKDALLVDGNLSISGNPPVGGACGNVHANENLSVSGNPIVAGDTTASGTSRTSRSPAIRR